MAIQIGDTGDTPRLLVVDDEPIIRELLVECLDGQDFIVEVTGSGESALELMKKRHFDVVLTDLKMPGIDGLELLRRIMDSKADVMVTLMTGYGTVETALEAMKKGAFDYILKPFKPDQVIRVLRRAVDEQRLKRENEYLRETVGFYALSEALASPMGIDKQLDLIVSMVQENFGADSVSIVVGGDGGNGKYTRRASYGPQDYGLRCERVMKQFNTGNQVLAHADQCDYWLERGKTPEKRIVQSFMAAPLTFRGEPFGILNVYSVDKGHKFTEGQRKGLSIFGGKAASAIETDRMHQKLRGTFTQTIEGFARALEAKDAYTHGHSDRVAMYSKLIAEAMGLPRVEVDRIQHGGLMHDIGKIGVRTHELNKPQKLTPREYEMFQSHPVQGKRIIEPVDFLVHLVPCVYHHHEAWNGTGYPLGLEDEAIPLEARILAVADTYDAMTSNRPYRKALPHPIALAEIKRCSGRQFDPAVVKAFLAVIEEFRTQMRQKGMPLPD